MTVDLHTYSGYISFGYPCLRVHWKMQVAMAASAAGRPIPMPTPKAILSEDDRRHLVQGRDGEF